MTTLSFDVLWRDRGASAGMQNLAKHTERTAKSFRALKVGAGIALVAATGAAIKFGVSSVKAYAQAEDAQKSLAFAFAKFPKLADTNQAALQRLNSALQKKTKFDDDNIASGQAVLAQFKLTGQQLTQITPLLVDYASKTGKDIPNAARDVGKALLGNAKALKNIGISYKSTGDAGKDFTNITALMREKVGGFAEREGATAAGRLAILKNQFGELQETIGSKVLPVLSKLVDGALKVVGLIQDNSAVFKTFGNTIKIVFSSIAESVGLGKGSFKDFSDFIATHQEDITAAIIKGGKAFVSLGKVVLTVASGALRAFGGLSDGVGHVVSFIIDQYALMAHGAAAAFGWIPDIGPKLIAADAKFAAFAKHAKDGIHTTGDAARGLADGIDKKLLPGLNKAGTGLDAMGKKAISAARARDIVARAEINHRLALDAATAAAKANGKTLDSNTVAGRANRVALNGLVSSSRNYIGKLVETGASSKRVTEATKTAKEEFIRVATKMGLGSAAAKDLATKYFKIPKKVETKTTQPGMSKARTETQGLSDDIKNLKPRNVAINFSTNAGKFGVKVPGPQKPRARGGILPGFTPLSKGDDIAFPMSNGGIQPLRGGEGIAVSEVMRDPHERALLLAKNKAALRGESMTKFRGMAEGGVVRRSITTPVMNPSALKEIGPAFARIAASLAASLGNRVGTVLQKKITTAMNAAGGPIGGKGYAAALNYARRHRGHPYIFGSLWDCSGFMSALHSIILGQRPHRRYTTTAFHGAHAAGFTRGKSSPFRVGVRPLSGRFGHMAGTLNGVNVESSGGVGVRVGGGARGAGSGMFSWRGGLAKGGMVGDMPFDLLDPQGQRYQPWLADLVHKAGYHRGGRIGGDGPERILSPVQNRNFEDLVRVLDRRGGAAVVHNHYTVNAPHYVGTQKDLVDALVKLNSRNQLAVLQR